MYRRICKIIFKLFQPSTQHRHQKHIMEISCDIRICTCNLLQTYRNGYSARFGRTKLRRSGGLGVLTVPGTRYLSINKATRNNTENYVF